MNKCNLIRKALLTYPIWVLVTSQSISLRLPSWSSPILMKQRPYQKRPRGPSPLPPTPFFAIFIQIIGFTPFTYGIVSSDVSEGQKSHTTLMLKCHPLFSVMTFSWNISSFNLWSQSGGVACQRQNHPQAIYSAKLHHNQLAGKKEARMAKHRWRRNCVTSTLNSTLLVWRALLARLEHAPCSLLSFIQKRIFVPSLIWESRKGIRTLKRKVFLISWFQQLNSIPL